MRAAVVCDCGPLIALAKLGRLDILLALFDVVHMPQAVLDEATAMRSRADGQAIAAFVQTQEQVRVWSNTTADQDPTLPTLLALLDDGEAQAIALAKRLACPVWMDEKRGRAVARAQGLVVLGLLGLLLAAKQRSLLTQVGPLLHRLDAAGYFIAPALKAQALLLAGEKSAKNA